MARGSMVPYGVAVQLLRDRLGLDDGQAYTFIVSAVRPGKLRATASSHSDASTLPVGHVDWHAPGALVNLKDLERLIAQARPSPPPVVAPAAEAPPRGKPGRKPAYPWEELALVFGILLWDERADD